MATTTEITTTLEHIECCACGITFGMTKDFVMRRRNDHEWFYCPSGHRQHFPQKSDAEKLRDQLQRQEDETRRANARAQRMADEAETAERRRRAAKGQLTKTRNRIAKGVCPCCNRHFNNLHRHMKSQHPNYTDTP